MDKEIGIQFGELYMVRNTIMNKAYVGQAQKYLSSGQVWGTHGRWTRHLRDAFIETRPDYNCMLHEAIRQYGGNAFIVMKLVDCHLDEIDAHEKKYIEEFNTMEPNGYNMTYGGKDGSHGEASNKKKQVKRKAYSQEAKDNMGRASLGRRYEAKERLHEQDCHLPKYVHAIRQEGVVIGYQVKKFPMGLEKKEYVYKTFKRKYDLPSALKDATEYVKKLQEEYETKLKEYKSKLEEEKKSEEQAQVLKLPETPDNVYPYIVNNKQVGYYVKGLKDYKGEIIPRRDFIDHTHSINLDHAIKFIEEVKSCNNLQFVPNDWLTLELSNKKKADDLPKYIRPQYYNGKEIGYRIDLFLGYNEEKQKIMVVKSFCNKKKTMEEKLNAAKQCLEDLLNTYRN